MPARNVDFKSTGQPVADGAAHRIIQTPPGSSLTWIYLKRGGPGASGAWQPFPQIDCGGCSTSSGNLNPYMCDPRKNIAAQEPRRGRETMGFMTAAPASPHHASSFVPYMQQTRGVLCCEATLASASHGPFLGSVEQTRNTEWRASQAAYPEREMCQCVTSQSLRCRPGRRCGSLSLQ